MRRRDVIHWYVFVASIGWACLIWGIAYLLATGLLR